MGTISAFFFPLANCEFSVHVFMPFHVHTYNVIQFVIHKERNMPNCGIWSGLENLCKCTFFPVHWFLVVEFRHILHEAAWCGINLLEAVERF